MMNPDLPIVIKCDGPCGGWIPPDTEPCATALDGIHGHRPLKMCDSCRNLLRVPRIETKVVSPSGDIHEIPAAPAPPRSSPEAMMAKAMQPERKKPGPKPRVR
jgi:hypothetical protein